MPHLMFHSIGGFIGGILGFVLAYPVNTPCGSTFFKQPSCQDFFGLSGAVVGNFVGAVGACALIGVVIGHVVQEMSKGTKGAGAGE
jgi:hypothetical protein